MNLAILTQELTADPLGRNYSGMSDVEAAGDLNTAYRSKNKTTMSGSDVLNAVVPAAFSALEADVQQRFWNIVHLGQLNPFGIEATLLVGIFGAGSDTIAALAAARVIAISRAVELGLGTVKAADVQRARA